MIISLIGMSNVGKSYWAKRLETEQGFQRFCCDELIEQQLHSILPLSKGELEGVALLASWMGMPFHEHYVDREAQYLSLEASVLESILDQLDPTQNVVIDTTGSVIYLLPMLLKRIKSSTILVYLQTHPQDLNEMIEQYFDHPKPVIWGNVFSKQEDETHEQALRRCYPVLLQHRASRYDELAHLSIPRQQLRTADYSTEQFLYEVLQHQQ